MVKKRKHFTCAARVINSRAHVGSKPILFAKYAVPVCVRYVVEHTQRNAS